MACCLGRRLESGQASSLRHDQFGIRDGVAVRVVGGMAEGGSHARFEIFRDDVLQAAGFLVDFVPTVSERLHQPGFEQAVVAEDFQRSAFAFRGERDALVFLVIHQGRFCGGQFLHHASDRGGLDPQPSGQVVGAGRRACFGQLEDVFQVILRWIG